MNYAYLNTLFVRKIVFCLLMISFLMSGYFAEAQIYYHNFGTTPISTNPYTVAPSVFDSHLSNSSWTNSIGAWTSNTGATGEAIRLTTTTPTTITLTFNVAANYQVDVTSFDFWTLRSALGPQNWTMTINGITAGSGTTGTVGAALGNTPVANTISGLTGTITVVISLSGQTGNGTYRLDDFTLNGTVTSTCIAATITSFSPTSGPQNTLVTINGSGFQSGAGASAVNFNGIPASSFTVVSDNLIKAYIPAGNVSGNISVVTNGCEGFSTGSFTVIQTTPNIVYATDLYISEIYDAQAGSGGVIEIYNGTASTISLSGYSIVRHPDIGAPSSYTLNLDPTLSIAPGQVFLIYVGTTTIPCSGLNYDQIYPGGGFNSNDQFELVNNTVIIDSVEISQAIITAQPGYSITRDPDAIGPQPIFNISDWTLTGTESCTDLGTHTTTPITLSSISNQPTTRTICENGTTTFSVTLTSPAGYSFQWKVQSGTGNWVNVINSANYSGAMTSILTLSSVPATFDTNQYYCQITSPSGTVVSQAAQLTVNGLNNPPTVVTTAPTCITDGFTTITNYNTANTYTFSPAGPIAGAGGTITGAAFGTAYSMTVTNGCPSGIPATFTNQIQLATPAVPTLSTTAPNCTANGFTTITNYNAAYTYTFSPVGPNAGAGGTITGATLGTAYTLTATNGGCTSASSASFINLNQLTIPAVPTLSTTAPSCTTNGFTTITNYNAAYTYTFSPVGPIAGAGGTITGATLGTAYTLTATSGGCTSASSASFTNLNQLVSPAVPTLSTTAPNCTANGFTTITNYNAAYTYTFSPVGPIAGAGGTITGATLGTAYTLTATNGGCTSAASAPFTNLNQLPTPAVPTLSTTAPNCTTNGFTTITNYNAAYTYTFSPVGPIAGAGGTITGATLGTTYTLTATSGGCTSASSASFTNLNQLATPAVPTLSTTAPNCTANGVTTITNYNVAYSYTFSPVGPNAGAGGTITGATLGTAYTLTATSGGCTSAASAPFTNLNQLVSPAVPTLSTTAPNCTANGFTTITNYNAAYTYTFSPVGPNASAGGTITGATLGTSYTVTAANTGCTSVASASFINLNQLPTPAVPTLSTTAPNCTANGFTTITNYNAAYTYTFSPAGPNAGAGGTITGATLGTAYTLTATNGGCTSASSASFTNLNQLVSPAVPTLSTTAPNCTANGFTTITNYNATYTYTFSPVGPNAGAGGTITGATLGTAYTLTATNGGCTSVASAPFTNLNQLPTPAMPTLSTTAPNCTTNGFTTITNYNAAYTYTFSPVGPIAGAGGTITGATLGTAYTLTATNGGCTSASSASFTNLNQLATPAVPTLSTTAPNCTTNGFTTITNYNAAYTYTFSPVGPNAGAGGTITGATLGTSYTVTAANTGCTSVASASFINFSFLSSIIISTPQPLQACDPNNDGFETFDLTQTINSITGGNPSYTVSFHETQVDANTGATPIPTPANYDNINPFLQTIYIRVTSSTSTCYQVVTLQLIINPTPVATEPADYELCDYTGLAGFESFDLTSTIPQILGTINPLTHAVTFYTTQGAAELGTGNIPNPTSYISDTQTIYVRVETTATGCYDIVTLQLIVNPLPNATQPNYPQYSLCDTTGAVGFETFDLASQIPSILLGQTGMDVTFYPSLSEAQSGSNAITNLQYPNAIIYVQTLGIRITNRDTGCYVISTMDIRVEPLPTPIPPTQPYTICDDDQDGFSCGFDLTTLLPGLLNGMTTYTITFHETIDDANTGDNPINTATPYCTLTRFVQTLYVRAEDNVTGCYSILPIELNTDPSPVAPVNLNTITVCDQDSNPQDARTPVDLTQTTAAVLAQQTGAASDYTVEYYTTQLLAQQGNSPIINDTSYPVSDGDTIWVRVEHKITGCYNVGSFQLAINTPLLLTTPTPLSVCDDDATPNNQFHVFDLTIKNTEINQGTGYTVTYYPSLTAAQNNTNVITTPSAYQNVPSHPAVQTLGVVVTTTAGCKSITTLDIRVLPIPTPNTNPTPLAPKCDDNNPGDMLEVFDLTVNQTYIGNGDPNLSFHYFATRDNAIDNVSELIPATAALVGTNVWIRVENNRVDYQGENCYVLVEQPLRVNPLPIVVQPLAPYRACDDNADGISVFDLTNPDLAEAILGTTQLPADFTISYHLTQANATAGTAPLPNSYTNVTPNTQDIYIRVVNNATGCVNTGILPLVVEAYARAEGPWDYNECDNDGNPYDGVGLIDLTSYAPDILDGQDATIFLLSYYTSLADAVAGTNALTLAQAQAYQTAANTDTIWVKVENSSNLITPVCYAITTINIRVEPYPNPVITTANDVTTICVDYITNQVVRPLTLNSGVANPNNYTYEWFEDASITPIPGATGPTYTVDTPAAGGATRAYTVRVTSATPQACQTTSATAFQVIQSGQAVVAAGTTGYTVTSAFSSEQIITVTVEGYGAPDYQYSLDDGPRQASNVFENVSMGTHVIHVWDAKGNIAYSCEELIINEVMIIDYPHYFTPNGDGIHDTWNIFDLADDQFAAKIFIFDRYGKLLKQISPKGAGWDGTYNGHLLPSDDYWFTVDFAEGGVMKQFKAHFAMKR